MMASFYPAYSSPPAILQRSSDPIPSPPLLQEDSQYMAMAKALTRAPISYTIKCIYTIYV